jgi:hypothetical protein
MAFVGRVEGEEPSSVLAPGSSRGITRRSLLARAAGAAVLPFAAPHAVRAMESAASPGPVVINGRAYDAYVPAALKPGQFYWYTCEFDAAWVVLKTFGYDVAFEEQIALTGHNQDPEPWYEETANGVYIYGADIGDTFCGDYTHNLLAKVRGTGMKKVFAAYGLRSKAVKSQDVIRNCLLRGGLVWMKVTVDFKEFIPAKWKATNGKTYRTAFTNDHAVVVMGFNSESLVIRDVLGPTDTNWTRAYEYEVPWPVFEASARASGWDGRAVYPPRR